MSLDVAYIADASVNDELDRQLRKLFTTCFTGPQDHVFEQQRYFHYPYPHRWIGRNPNGDIFAHIGVHERTVDIDGVKHGVGGIGDVCIHPDFRWQGYVRKMLAMIHEWLPSNGFSFALLFGDPVVYRSSGYTPVTNLFATSSAPGKHLDSAQVKPLADISWPAMNVSMEDIPF